jgi:hypothetical protein
LIQQAKEPAPQAVKTYLESIRNKDFKGIPLSFDPEQRTLSTRVWIETDNDQPWIERTIKDLDNQAKKGAEKTLPPAPKTEPINSSKTPQKP